MNSTNEKFKKLINNLPLNWIDIENNNYVGLKNKDGNKLGYYAFEVNEKDANFCFASGDILHKLLNIFVKSAYCESIETLSIGRFNESHGSYDYEESVKILETNSFPNLKNFSIGFFDELYNGGMNFAGKMGDITKLLEQMPKLERLEIDGYFELKKALTFLNLKDLNILSDSDTASWFEGSMPYDISQQTLDNILLSKFPKLIKFEIGLDDESSFTFHQEFLDAKNLPSLKILNIEGGFAIGEEKKLLESSLAEVYQIRGIVSKNVNS